MGRHYYKRGWGHTKTRGHESTVTCDFCGRKVPKYKTFTVFKGFRITDPVVRQELRKQNINMYSTVSKARACPACARHRNIVRKKNQQK
jgi:small subunit ribosomal protein S26e